MLTYRFLARMVLWSIGSGIRTSRLRPSQGLAHRPNGFTAELTVPPIGQSCT